MQVFEYGANEIAHLKSRDKLPGAAIDRYRVLAISRGMMNLYMLKSLPPVVFEQYRK